MVAAGHAVATLHNHPGSSIPSAADVLSIKRTGAKFGAIACHDGSLYVYEVVGEPAPGYKIWYDKDHDSIVDAFDLRMAGTKKSASDERRALDGIEMVFGVRIVHLQASS